MHCSRMPRLCAIPTALLLVTCVARGQVPATPDTTFGLPGNEPLALSTPLPDESKHKTVKPFCDHDARLRLEQQGRRALTAGSVPDQSNGVAWATVTAPGFQFPLGWTATCAGLLPRGS